MHVEDGPLNSIDYYQVDPQTIGQYTGIKDKYGNKIFEGDILKSSSGLRKIEWFRNGFWNMALNSDGKFPITFYGEDKLEYEIAEGNIHDNPELLK